MILKKQFKQVRNITTSEEEMAHELMNKDSTISCFTEAINQVRNRQKTLREFV